MHRRKHPICVSDHYAMAIEVQLRAALKRGESRTFTNIMFHIERSPEEEKRHAQCTAQTEEEEPIPEEREQKTESVEVKEVREVEDQEKASMPDKWKRITRKAMELKVALRKLAKAIPSETQEEIHREVREVRHDTGWVSKDEEDTENKSSSLEQARTEEAEEAEIDQKAGIDQSSTRGWANTTEGKI